MKILKVPIPEQTQDFDKSGNQVATKTKSKKNKRARSK